MSKREIFDLCYLLKSTFYHAFPELDLKNEITRGIFPIDIEKVEVPSGSKEFKNPDDNRIYPIVQLNGLSWAVDPSRGFLNFLKYVQIHSFLELIRSTRKGISSYFRSYCEQRPVLLS
jgi:hypothetical protein